MTAFGREIPKILLRADGYAVGKNDAIPYADRDMAIAAWILRSRLSFETGTVNIFQARLVLAMIIGKEFVDPSCAGSRVPQLGFAPTDCHIFELVRDLDCASSFLALPRPSVRWNEPTGWNTIVWNRGIIGAEGNPITDEFLLPVANKFLSDDKFYTHFENYAGYPSIGNIDQDLCVASKRPANVECMACRDDVVRGFEQSGIPDDCCDACREAKAGVRCASCHSTTVNLYVSKQRGLSLNIYRFDFGPGKGSVRRRYAPASCYIPLLQLYCAMVVTDDFRMECMKVIKYVLARYEEIEVNQIAGYTPSDPAPPVETPEVPKEPEAPKAPKAPKEPERTPLPDIPDRVFVSNTFTDWKIATLYIRGEKGGPVCAILAPKNGTHEDLVLPLQAALRDTTRKYYVPVGNYYVKVGPQMTKLQKVGDAPICFGTRKLKEAIDALAVKNLRKEAEERHSTSE